MNLHTKGKDSKRKAPITHKDVCTATGKISAYLRCGDKEKAREWALRLVHYLQEMDLLPWRDKDDV